MDINDLLRMMVEKGASDLHLKVPRPPVLRIGGVLLPQEEMSPMNAKDIDAVFEQVTTEDKRAIFNKKHELDFSYSISGLARFRVNVMQQRGTKSIAFRCIPFEIPTIDGLGLPQVLKEIILLRRGLVLISGPSGSGKSTTLAAMIDYLNDTVKKNVITIEDPIEFLYKDKKSIIRQRDLGDDTDSFTVALTHALRHDAEIIVLGEMRDLDTTSTAITAAETGHLVLGTLHTNNVAQTIDRMIDIFPHEYQQQIRMQLAHVVTAVTAQMLLPLIDGGQIAAFEIMRTNSVISNYIRDNKIADLPRFLDVNLDVGMQSMNRSLAELVMQGKVSQEDAMLRSHDRAGLAKMLKEAKTTA